MNSQGQSVDYQTLKQLRDDLITEIHDSNLHENDDICPEDYNALLYFLDEYEELTRKMLQLLKKQEQVGLSNFSLDK